MSQPRSDAAGDVETQPLTNPPQSSVEVKRIEASTVLLVVVWMVVSSAVVLYNKWVFSTGGFPYPLALTAMHMTCCFVVFGTIRKLAPQGIRLTIMPDADVATSWSAYFKNFIPISLFFAFTLGTGNFAYLYSSVAFIQMMKPFNCICASVAAFAIGVEAPTCSHLIIMSVIVLGILTATGNTGQFSLAGCILQLASSLSEGCRLALMQAITTGGLKLDPVTTVYHFSSASAVLLWCAHFAIEGSFNFSTLLSPWILVINCAMALFLNVLIAAMIKKTSAVAFTLCGVVKDLGIVFASSILFLTPITRLMLLGYSISLAGLIMYKAYKDNLQLFAERGFLRGMHQVAKAAVSKKRTGSTL